MKNRSWSPSFAAVLLLAVVAAFAGCAGGGTRSASSLPSGGGGSNPNSVKQGYKVAIDIGERKAPSLARRHPKQITADVDTIDVVIDGTDNLISLGYCPQVGPAYECTVSAAPGVHAINVQTESSGNVVGLSTAQSASVAVGQATPLSFVETPLAVATSLTLSYLSQSAVVSLSLPEDGASYPITATADILTPDSEDIASPIDTVNVFGTVNVTTTPAFPVTSPAPLATGYTDGYTIAYDGSEVAGDSITVNESYTNNASSAAATYNGDSTAAAAPAAATIALTRVSLPPTPNPSPQAAHGCDGSDWDVTDSYCYAPASGGNNGNAVIAFNSGATTDFTTLVTTTNDNFRGITLGGSCPADISWHDSTGDYVGVDTITQVVVYASEVLNAGLTGPCTILIQSVKFPSLVQTLTVEPPGYYTVSASVRHRKT